ncbi:MULTISPECIES: 2-dehydro-3-deoxy-phosphogluconate aldolase [Virgibacillus]|uniref:2-dehydro-3-deoxy-phosphogluconate aldolase n=1 Tax=Virgibacillus TaxID=84406 RepID=UPI0003886010|nr:MULTISPECIES: KDGP aldolase family protein [Virgibacillus]EQB37455.1 4-hydroxy-2-ketovalerate aldolase [Virgibacillus sp. CM-4]MYL40206.1 oxo-acid lyase [Virgibacillus massiliensis]
MSTIKKRFYKDRVALNVLADDIENAKEVFEAAYGYVLIGVLSKNYETVEQAVAAMKEYGKAIDEAVSIGLGAGDNRQAAVVAEIASQYPGSHINQVFPAVGATRAKLGGEDSWINALVSPTGKVGYVNISTGPISASQHEQAIVPIKTAIGLVRDMGGDALKYFPMKGLRYEEEYRAVANACGEEGFGLEPTGGIDKENYESLLQIALEANVPKIIPHVYSSIIDKATGKTKVDDVAELIQMTKKLVDSDE